jgi:hypothetical protein
MESQAKPTIAPVPVRSLGINFQEILARAIKYIVEGGAVALAAWLIPKKKLPLQEIIMVALTAAAVFAILDLYAPSVGAASRQGAGFGIGFGLTGMSGMTLPGGVVVPGIPPMA